MLARCFLLLGIFSLTAVDGHFLYHKCFCPVSGRDVHEYIYSLVVNKVKVLEYNSTLNRFIGYTEFGFINAERLNNIPEEVANQHAGLDTYCKYNTPIFYNAIYDKTVEPLVHLRSTTPHSNRHPSMLMCSASEFYPKQIRVTWLRDGQEATLDVISSEELADGDWYYQIHSYLEFTPKPGEKISCMVEHVSLSDPMILHWDPSMPESERNKIAIGASSLVLGVVFAAAGLIYYNRRTASGGRQLVPSIQPTQ